MCEVEKAAKLGSRPLSSDLANKTEGHELRPKQEGQQTRPIRRVDVVLF